MMLFDDPLLVLADRLAAGAADPLGAADRAAAELIGPAVAGVDEAGRGALAGPLVVAATIPPVGWHTAPPAGLNDSKQLTASTRDRLFVEVLNACKVAVVVVQAGTIDRVGIVEANLTGMARAAHAVGPADVVLFDGFAPGRPHGWDGATDSLPLVKGDRCSVAIAAASIVAKVTHDRILAALDRDHPGYGLADNQGYGTAGHLAAIRRHGATAAHRASFLPAEDRTGTLA